MKPKFFIPIGHALGGGSLQEALDAKFFSEVIDGKRFRFAVHSALDKPQLLELSHFDSGYKILSVGEIKTLTKGWTTHGREVLRKAIEELGEARMAALLSSARTFQNARRVAAQALKNSPKVGLQVVDAQAVPASFARSLLLSSASTNPTPIGYLVEGKTTRLYVHGRDAPTLTTLNGNDPVVHITALTALGCVVKKDPKRPLEPSS